MADSWNDRLETLQKTLDDFIKFATDRFNVMEETKEIGRQTRQPGAYGE